MNNPLPLARKNEIARRLSGGQSVSASDLATEFDVSEDAIRRDLRALAAEGLCKRVYGGAMPAGQPMAVRKETAVGNKTALARAGAATILPGELVFLDSGSTNLAIVPFLPEDSGITVATNSIDIAAAVLQRHDVRLIMIGGVVTTAVGGCVDADAVAAVSRLNIDRLFLGACALAADTGVSAFDPADAIFKRAVLAASRLSLAMVTNEKLGTHAPHRIAGVSQIAAFIVEHDVANAGESAGTALQALLSAGAQITKADAHD